jgi:23S rRNA (guanosine2251-2'-O)-methyltransferase
MKDDLVYGMNPVLEALRGTRRAFELFVAKNLNDRRLEKILLVAKEKEVPVRQRDKADLARISGTEHHQGVVLRMEPFVYADLHDLLDRCRAEGEPGLVLVLDGIQDPHNLGALIRSAACAGAQGVIIPKDRAVGVTPTVEKVSAGAVETVPVVQVANIVQALDLLKEAGFWTYGLAGEGAASLYDQKLSGKIALVVGGEGDGIRPLVLKSCDMVVAIPLAGGVNSLNASVAGGVALFEVVRQRRK